MHAEKDIGSAPERVVFRQRLRHGYVQKSPRQGTTDKRGNKCILINEASARNVYKAGTLFHRGHFRLAEPIACVISSWDGQYHPIEFIPPSPHFVCPNAAVGMNGTAHNA